jgi:hypothetical protein
VLVMEVAQFGAVIKLGWSSVFVIGCSSRGVQVGCCEFLVSIVRCQGESTRRGAKKENNFIQPVT